ncbi:MAG: hypothetical protein AAGF20_10575 [Pseudomonadota bacterium]
MKKWLSLLLGLSLAVLAAIWWLGQSLDQQKPASGEVRMEIDHVF